MTHAKKTRVKIEGMPKVPTLASERLGLLIRQLQRDLGPVRGADARIAEVLDIDPSSVGRVPKGERGISLASIEKICKRVKLHPDYFSAERPKTPEYKQYLESDSPLWDLIAPTATTIAPTTSPGTREPSSPGTETAAARVDVDEMLDAIAASAEEREEWAAYVKLFPVPYYDGSHAAVFVGGLRSKLRRQEAIDRAVTSSAESARLDSGRRKVDGND